jgi:hypothetical protein
MINTYRCTACTRMVCTAPDQLCVDCVANAAIHVAATGRPMPCPVCGKTPAVIEFEHGLTVGLGFFGKADARPWAVWCSMQDGGCGFSVRGASGEATIAEWNCTPSEVASSHRERVRIMFGWPPKL